MGAILHGMMIPVGYMAKRVAKKLPDFMAYNVEEIYSVSSCISDDFADYVNFWQHNGYWLFDSPEIITKIATENNIDLNGTTIFYYEAWEWQYCDRASRWEKYFPERSLMTNVILPSSKTLMGYDIVSFTMGNLPEHSYLSCNYMAAEIAVNQYCLLNDLEVAKKLINDGVFVDCEPGPCRIFAVYRV